MKFLLMVGALILIETSAQAQTRRIAHRFHSGDGMERYDDNDGNNGIPMPVKHYTGSYVPISVAPKDDGRIYYRWDTVDYSTPASMNVTNHKRVARMRDLGNICTTLTTR